MSFGASVVDVGFTLAHARPLLELHENVRAAEFSPSFVKVKTSITFVVPFDTTQVSYTG